MYAPASFDDSTVVRYRSASTFRAKDRLRCWPAGSRHRASHDVWPARIRFSTLATVGSLRLGVAEKAKLLGVVDDAGRFQVGNPFLRQTRWTQAGLNH